MVDVKVIVSGDSDPLGNLLALLDPDVIVEAIATVAYARWVELAHQTLHKTRAAYIEAIQPPQLNGDGTATIELAGDSALANAVEGGMDPYDFRQTHLKGEQSKVIAFEHDAPGKGSAPLGYAFRQAAGIGGAKAIGRNVAKQAQAMRPGGRLRGGTAPLLKPGQVYGPETHHWSDPYAGLQKRARATPGGGGSNYLVFRTLSAEGQPGSWRHPGIEARRLIERVEADLERLAPAVIDGIVQAVLGND